VSLLRHGTEADPSVHKDQSQVQFLKSWREYLTQLLQY
jgi:hypothetical protein